LYILRVRAIPTYRVYRLYDKTSLLHLFNEHWLERSHDYNLVIAQFTKTKGCLTRRVQGICSQPSPYYFNHAPLCQLNVPWLWFRAFVNIFLQHYIAHITSNTGSSELITWITSIPLILPRMDVINYTVLSFAHPTDLKTQLYP